jgi:hypothetical protein
MIAENQTISGKFEGIEFCDSVFGNQVSESYFFSLRAMVTTKGM